MRKHQNISYCSFLFTIGFVMLLSCQNTSPKLEGSSIIIERKVDSLLDLMTLEEKIGQMTQVRHFSDIQKGDVASKYIGSVIHTDGPLPGEDALGWQAKFVELQKEALSTRLGIPLLFGVDAVHGQNTFSGATIFPHNIGLGATGNPDLVQKAARITAIEAQATGFNWVFSPCVAIPYNEKWGRVYEAFSESTELTRAMTKASIKGHQGYLLDRTTVMATAKHYIGDGSTDFGVEGGNTTLTDNEITERLLPPYRDAVTMGVGSIMASFNTLNNQALHAHKALITDTLKTKMGFDGIVLTDWKGYSKYGKNDIINAGIDMVMAVDGDLELFQQGLKKGVEQDSVSQDRIDDAVKRILRQKYRLGLFEHPFPDATLVSKIGSSDHRNVAKQAVRESLVLLKNENSVLPINKEAGKIVVVGEHANNSGLQSGGWTISWQGKPENYKGATTILEGVKKISSSKIVYDKNGTGKHFDAQVAIIVVGEKPYAEFFGDVNNNTGFTLTLSKSHQDYIKAYTEADVSTVVVLISGRPLVISNQLKQSDAFVAAWLPGSEGDGIAEVLFGAYNFSGKLPHSWPESVNDFQGRFGPNFWDDTIKPLFDFGYGLNYEAIVKVN
ncbi:glycoside hydrolase family 3 N-terminal domain-containing protein [uncultured Algibacter sp.]|uniref:glycoside hydrolase family 3 protein n=1 Tax=uncultured Algibacter sp. TaxID=298659 RepID=UPI002639B606|nr:glycoside hydrolase family 3 N-terminal domain-containing protein [uncultured Algibacter sp.]